MQGIVRPGQNSLILDLPDELTYNIFLDCHRDNPQEFPWIASTVCSQWRYIALSIPVLWSTVAFNRSLQNQQVARTIEAQLERARTTPLEIRIFQSALHEPQTESMLQIIELISPSAQRWRSLVIEKTVQSLALQVLFDYLTNASAPQLEKLAIERESRARVGVDWEFRAFSNGLPRLQFLHLSKCRIDWNSDIFNNLVELEVQDLYFYRMTRDQLVTLVRSLLIRSPRLRSLDIAGDVRRDLIIEPNRPPPTPPQEILVHNSIECLRISLYEGEVTDALLHSVNMPSLHIATNRSSFYSILPFSFHTLAYLNPLPNLRRIRIRGHSQSTANSPEENTALPLALQAMRSLEVLEFLALDLTGSDAWLPDLLVWLPRLGELRFEDCPGLLASAIKEMVRRCSNPKRLVLALLTENPGDSWRDSLDLATFLRPRLGKFSTRLSPLRASCLS